MLRRVSGAGVQVSGPEGGFEGKPVPEGADRLVEGVSGLSEIHVLVIHGEESVEGASDVGGIFVVDLPQGAYYVRESGKLER